MNILFVCTGNTCRSPMAEAILKHKDPSFNVQSADIYADKFDKANPHTIKVLEDRGISIDHMSQPMTAELLNWADYVFTMTMTHKRHIILQQYGVKKDLKVYTLKQFIEDSESNSEQELDHAYKDFAQKEEKLRNKKGNITEEEIKTSLSEELTHIYNLQDKIKSFDVSDPFGSSLDQYEATYAELDHAIDQLINQIKKQIKG